MTPPLNYLLWNLDKSYNEDPSTTGELLQIIDKVLDRPDFDPNLQNVDSEGRDTSLHFLIKKVIFPLTKENSAAKVSFYKKILEKLATLEKADLNLKDISGFTPLLSVFQYGSGLEDTTVTEDVLRSLLKARNIDFTIQAKNKLNPVCYALKFLTDDRATDLILDIINRSPKEAIEHGDTGAFSLLHYLVQGPDSMSMSNKQKLAKALLEKGASGDIQGLGGRTAKEIALEVGFSVTLSDGTQWPS